MSWATEQIQRAAQWSSLTKLGKSRIIQSSYVWLIIVPAIAKIIEPMQLLGEVSTFEVFGAPMELHVGLPFSWKVFYVSAVFLSIASLVYQACCPRVIKDLDGNRLRVSEIDYAASEFYVKQMGLKVETPYVGDRIPQDFAAYVWHDAERINPFAKWTCGAFYASGLLLIGWVILENLVYVLPLIF